MTEHSFSTTILVAATPAETFAAINDVRAWWSQDVEGSTVAVGAEFTFYGSDVHRSRIRVTDLVPGELVAWHVIDNWMSFVQDQTEWKDTRIRFEISETGSGTQVRFSHVGLVPTYECFDVCSNAWSFFVNDSLRALIETGEGQPMASERTARAS